MRFSQEKQGHRGESKIAAKGPTSPGRRTKQVKPSNVAEDLNKTDSKDTSSDAIVKMSVYDIGSAIFKSLTNVALGELWIMNERGDLQDIHVTRSVRDCVNQLKMIAHDMKFATEAGTNASDVLERLLTDLMGRTVKVTEENEAFTKVGPNK